VAEEEDMSAKIVKLDIQNIMRINAVHIEPDGNVVVLGGRNAQGKTSVLDAISMAIGGLKLCPDVPIREGEDAAEIVLTLGDMEITRRFTRKGDTFTSTLAVKNAKGQPLSPPQKTLDALIGRLAFDPLEFARMSPADARETLRELVGLDVEQLELEKHRVYCLRTDAGVAKRAAQAVVDELPIPGEVPDQIPTEAFTKEIAEASRQVADHEELKGIYDRAVESLNALHRQGATLQSRICGLRTELEAVDLEVDAKIKLVEMAEQAKDDFTLPDFDKIKRRLDSALVENSLADEIQRSNDRYGEKVEQAEEKAAEWKEHDTTHNQIAHKIKKLTEAVEYPIEDMELRPEGVFYQGVPFEQGSRAERIKVSLAMGMAMNDKLRVLLIRDGSVLDDESMTTILRLAEEQDFQFWIEMARGYEGAAGAVVIEDGGVV
jgi:DNA repair exonuclease SbcCD ATPase subunit